MTKSISAVILAFAVGPLSAGATASPVIASTAAPAQLDGIDLAPAVKYFRPFVKTLGQSVTVYNWSPATDTNDDASRAVRTAYRRSETFWNEFGKPDSAQAMYGKGLYGAVDPVLTAGYGGFPVSNGWLLFEMELPIGFRMVDLADANAAANAPSALFPAVQKIEMQFGCPVHRNLEPYFQLGGAGLTPNCQKLVRKLFKELLPIDGFAYGYGETYYEACQSLGGVSARAFVVTGSDWVRPELVRLYTTKTTRDPEARARLQTLFFSNKNAKPAVPSANVDAITTYLIANPDRELRSSVSVCQGNLCVLSAKFCDDQNQCDVIPVASLPRPGGSVITRAEAQANGAGLLWDDLEGRPKATDTKEWLQKNKFACTGKDPYANANAGSSADGE